MARPSRTEEKKGKVMWEAREGNFLSTPIKHTSGPLLKRGLLLLDFCFLTYRFLLKHCLDPSKKKKKKKPLWKTEGDCAQEKYWRL